MTEPRPPAPHDSDFARLAHRRRSSLLGELWAFLRVTRKWWLAPIIVVLLLVAVLVIFGGSSVAPFIYALF